LPKTFSPSYQILYHLRAWGFLFGRPVAVANQAGVISDGAAILLFESPPVGLLEVLAPVAGPRELSLRFNQEEFCDEL